MGACVTKPVHPQQTETPVEVFRNEPLSPASTSGDHSVAVDALRDAVSPGRSNVSPTGVPPSPVDLRKSRDKSIFSKKQQPDAVKTHGQERESLIGRIAKVQHAEKAVQAGGMQVRHAWLGFCLLHVFPVAAACGIYHQFGIAVVSVATGEVHNCR